MIRAIVTDIEGTTSSIGFVKDVLFPYARAKLSAFVAAHENDAEVRRWLCEAAREAGLAAPGRREIVDLLIRWIDEDRKATPLKALQGLIWKDGYASGAFKGHVYPEVAKNLQKWKKQKIHLYIYSSGSIAAQKLLFGHSEAGDLTPLFSGYFDTETGGKREAASYRRIAASIAAAPDEILFLSDMTAELDAAAAAGLHTIRLVRPPGRPAAGPHIEVADFDEISAG